MTNTAMRWILGSAMMVGAAVVVAQPLGIPPGRWWEQPKVAEQLALTADQTQQLNTLTLGHARTMVDLKGAVEKAEIDLRAAAETDPLDAKQVRQNFAALQQTRMRLESERFDMLLKVRQVLTTEQWPKIREIIRQRRERADSMGGDAGRKPLRKWRN